YSGADPVFAGAYAWAPGAFAGGGDNCEAPDMYPEQELPEGLFESGAICGSVWVDGNYQLPTAICFQLDTEGGPYTVIDCRRGFELECQTCETPRDDKCCRVVEASWYAPSEWDPVLVNRPGQYLCAFVNSADSAIGAGVALDSDGDGTIDLLDK